MVSIWSVDLIFIDLSGTLSKMGYVVDVKLKRIFFEIRLRVLQS